MHTANMFHVEATSNLKMLVNEMSYSHFNGKCRKMTSMKSEFIFGNNFVLNEKIIPMSPANRSKLKKMIDRDEDFKINIHAPVEDTQEVLESLDSLMRVEEIQRKVDEEEFMEDKQRLLKVHKKRIQ
ncbi:hypothetical protein AK88_04526 [Plasmodium fragile]|uniref:Uncharacterized protein n=1 Tax=Plasmodium fragile TaxID=5857 RepID=A0A0D9QFN7_PLAFR|nr:uncharacterized protein AK88_04526 [Plasmodium fragile]KJP85819.1 hypothetical protein AK88_04526 [Plasmodium fragile]